MNDFRFIINYSFLKQIMHPFVLTMLFVLIIIIVTIFLVKKELKRGDV